MSLVHIMLGISAYLAASVIFLKTWTVRGKMTYFEKGQLVPDSTDKNEKFRESGYYVKGWYDHSDYSSDNPWYSYDAAKALSFFFWIPASIMILVRTAICLMLVTVGGVVWVPMKAISHLYNFFTMPRKPKQLESAPIDPYMIEANKEVEELIS